MAKYNLVSEWLNASISEKTRTFLQAFANGAAKDQGVILQEGDVIRWSLKSSGTMGLAVFRPEQVEQRKAPVKPSPVALPPGVTPELLAQALAIVAAQPQAPSKKKARK